MLSSETSVESSPHCSLTWHVRGPVSPPVIHVVPAYCSWPGKDTTTVAGRTHTNKTGIPQSQYSTENCLTDTAVNCGSINTNYTHFVSNLFLLFSEGVQFFVCFLSQFLVLLGFFEGCHAGSFYQVWICSHRIMVTGWHKYVQVQIYTMCTPVFHGYITVQIETMQLPYQLYLSRAMGKRILWHKISKFSLAG